MFYPLLDLIACPSCKYPLTLLIPLEEQRATSMRMRPARRASPEGVAVGPLPPSRTESRLWRLLAPRAASPATNRQEQSTWIVEGLLVCANCQRWYPIRKGLPELLPDHLRSWDADREWLSAREAELEAAELLEVAKLLIAHAGPMDHLSSDKGAHHKRAEMAIANGALPAGFFAAGLVAPFFPLQPHFSLDLLARYVTTVSRLNLGINGFVLDIGVGYAWTTEWLARLGYQAIGVDITRDYVEAGLARMSTHLPHFVIGDLENLPLSDELVDAVLSFDAFHHLPNRQQAMRELSRAMRPGTRMVLVEPGKEHEHTPQSIAVMQQYGILERGFDEDDLRGYIAGTSLGEVHHYRSDVHPHDVFTVQKEGSFITDSLSPRALIAEMSVRPQQASIPARSRAEYEVSITNRGDTIWLHKTQSGDGEVYLGANLYDSHRRLLQEDYARISLPCSVAPGQQVHLQCALPPLEHAGEYLIEFDMVDSGFLAFRQYAYQPVSLSLFVEASGVATADPTNSTTTKDADSPMIREPQPAGTASTELKQVYSNRVQVNRLLPLAWRVVKSEGIASLARKTASYLRAARS